MRTTCAGVVACQGHHSNNYAPWLEPTIPGVVLYYIALHIAIDTGNYSEVQRKDRSYFSQSAIAALERPGSQHHNLTARQETSSVGKLLLLSQHRCSLIIACALGNSRVERLSGFVLHVNQTDYHNPLVWRQRATQQHC